MYDKTIYLDMDGVLVDLYSSTMELFGHPRESVSQITEWNGMHKLVGKPERQFWTEVDASGVEFWANLEPYPWCFDLLKECQEIASTIIMTSTTRSPNCAAGKMMWMQKHFGVGFRDYALTPKKVECAAPGKILIDDREDTIERFQDAGGNGILFPQHWNSRRIFADDPYGFISEILDEL